MLEENVIDFKKHLEMYPFNEHLSSENKTKHREFMISRSNFVIFMYGTGSCNSGMFEEYSIAKSNPNKIIIPIGVTGGSAKKILEDIRNNIIKYPYLEKYINALANEKDPQIIARIVISIIHENLNNAI